MNRESLPPESVEGFLRQGMSAHEIRVFYIASKYC